MREDNPAETSMLTDFDMAPYEPMNSARIRETADQAADRLRPRPSQAGPAPQAGGLIWAWPPASPFQRMLAGGIDLIVPALGAVGAAFIARLCGAETSGRIAWAFGSFLLLGLAVDLVGGWIWRGVSPGKRLCGIHVRLQNGQLPSPARAVARSLTKWLLLPFCFWAAMDSQARGLHDLFCGTRVLFGRGR